MQRLIKKWQDKKYRSYFRILFFIYLILMLSATLMPVELLADKKESWFSNLQFKNEDKVVHFILFFIFTLLLFFAQFFREKKYLIILPFALGILIEALQLLMNLGRSFDVWDILANISGNLAAYGLAMKYLSKNDTIPH